MEGIGERFGSSFDDVRRDPRPIALALAFDLVAGVALLAAAAAVATQVPPPRFAGFGVPSALATFTDLLSAPLTLVEAGGEVGGVWAAAALAVLLAPVAAYLEGGAVGVLKAAYVDREQGPLAPRFREAARAAFPPLLAYRLLLHAGLVAGFVAGRMLPGSRGEVVGAIVLRFLLVFTPFLVVLERESAWGAMKRSAGHVADHLATCLVMLLFGLLVTGGASALLRELTGFFGPWTLPLAALVWAPVGTALSVFVMKVWLSFRPEDVEPQKAAPAGAPSPG